MTRLELFYDLVFVFALLNVTVLLSETLTGPSLLGGFVVLALLWWCWTGFAVVGNNVRADQGVIPLVSLVTTAAVFVLALTIPEAFHDEPGGLPGPFVFASCYFVVRGLQVLVLGWVVGAEVGWVRRLLLAVPALISTVLILAAALLPLRELEEPAESGARLGLWAIALLVEYGVGMVLRTIGGNVVSAGHWAERHALIVLVALGESIISLGTGPGPSLRSGLPITWPIILAAVSGITVISGLWWAYFDSLALAVEQRLHRVHGLARITLARDAYTYLHLPMIAGIIMFALGLKRILIEIADPKVSGWRDTVDRMDVFVLYAGVMIYQLALLGLAVRAFRTIRVAPTGAATVLILLIPLAVRVPAIVALGMLTLIILILMVVQVWRSSPSRHRIREEALGEQIALEVEETKWRRRHR